MHRNTLLLWTLAAKLLAASDPALALVSDPVLAYSTYLGGTVDDVLRGIAVDGNALRLIQATAANARAEPVAFSLSTKASLRGPVKSASRACARWYAPAVVGKSREFVQPVTRDAVSPLTPRATRQ